MYLNVHESTPHQREDPLNTLHKLCVCVCVVQNKSIHIEEMIEGLLFIYRWVWENR